MIDKKLHNINKVINKNKILNQYRSVCGKKSIDRLCARAKIFADKNILFVTSTYQGGGVAELLNGVVFFANLIGIKIEWRVLNGNVDFFKITKKFHNALQGEKINLSGKKKNLYYLTNAKFAAVTNLCHDLVVVHDPQPLPLIDFYEKNQPWILWCHIDFSNPYMPILNYLKKFIKQYDKVIVSKKEYQQPSLAVPTSIIPPAINPLATKNMPLNKKTIQGYFHKYGIPTDRPIVAQVSRFDKWKDPLGVIEVFSAIRKQHDCFLVLLGSLAGDDPEGPRVYEEVKQAVKDHEYSRDIKVILVNSDILVNCIQRGATVIIQKSIREGFGLVVSEALFKGTPVIASKVGGITLQIIDGFNGYLIDPYDTQGFADKALLVIKNKKLRKYLGMNGINYVKNNFLISRLMEDMLNTFEPYLDSPYCNKEYYNS